MFSGLPLIAFLIGDTMEANRDKTTKMGQMGGAEQQPNIDTLTVQGTMKPVKAEKLAKMGLKKDCKNNRGNI